MQINPKAHTYVVRLNIPNYQHGTPFDAHECFIYLLDCCYPTLNDVENSMFRFSKHEDIVCEINNSGCGRTFSRHETSLVFSLNLENTVEQQSIQGLLNKMLDPHGHQIPEYKCEMENGIGRNIKGCYTKSTSITDIKVIFIIQLTIFSYERLGNTQKIIPNLIID